MTEKCYPFDTKKVDEIVERLHIQTVGNGYIDMICPKENIGAFIDEMNALGIRIYGFTWWCYATDSHKPCGMGGPKNRYGEGRYSEIEMGKVILHDSCNNEIRDFLLNAWPNSEDYKPCHTPAFWLEP